MNWILRNDLLISRASASEMRFIKYTSGSRNKEWNRWAKWGKKKSWHQNGDVFSCCICRLLPYPIIVVPGITLYYLFISLCSLSHSLSFALAVHISRSLFGSDYVLCTQNGAIPANVHFADLANCKLHATFVLIPVPATPSTNPLCLPICTGRNAHPVHILQLSN